MLTRFIWLRIGSNGGLLWTDLCEELPGSIKVVKCHVCLSFSFLSDFDKMQ
jgi:hypothetical protein